MSKLDFSKVRNESSELCFCSSLSTRRHSRDALRYDTVRYDMVDELPPISFLSSTQNAKVPSFVHFGPGQSTDHSRTPGETEMAVWSLLLEAITIPHLRSKNSLISFLKRSFFHFEVCVGQITIAHQKGRTSAERRKKTKMKGETAPSWDVLDSQIGLPFRRIYLPEEASLVRLSSRCI